MTARILAAALLVTLPGCSDSRPTSESAETGAVLAGSAATLEALGSRALIALVAADTAAADALRLTEREHNEVIYPELPAAASFPVDLAWENVQRRSRRDLGRQIARFGGRDLAYDGTFCQGETQAYRTFEVRTDCWVVFRDAERGRFRVQLFEDVIVRGGGHKIVRWYDEGPRRLQDR
jgi:hypothetical protein